MTKTITSLFHSEQHATTAAHHLERTGIPRDRVDIWSTPHNLAAVLEDAGVAAADAHAYVEGVRRGGSLVIVRCDEAEVERVVGILDREGVLDLDEQQAAWRREGWPGYEALPSGGTTAASERDEAGPVASTEPQGGLHPADHGRVRIQSFVVVKRIGQE